MNLDIIKELNSEQLEFINHILQKEAERKFQEALAAAKLEFKPIKRTQSVSYPTRNGKKKSYNYADLKALHEAIDEPLAKHGLTVRTDTGKTENGAQWAVTVISGHGHTLRTSYQEGFAVNSIQEEGAQGTYIERYSLSKALGLSSDDDTDADQFRDVDQRQQEQQLQTIDQTKMNVIGNKINKISSRIDGKKPKEVSAELEKKIGCPIRQLPINRFTEVMDILNSWEA